MLARLGWGRGTGFLRLDGSTKVAERQALIDNFQRNTTIFCFLLSTKAGGLGINLTEANTVIFYGSPPPWPPPQRRSSPAPADLDFNPQNDRQAEDRAHRCGQKRLVTIYRLIATGTVDELILRRADAKLELDARMDAGQPADLFREMLALP